MRDQEKVRALYTVMTGYRYEEKRTFFLDRSDLWQSASIIFEQLAPTEEQIGALLMLKFGAIEEKDVEKKPEETKRPDEKETVNGEEVHEDKISVAQADAEQGASEDLEQGQPVEPFHAT